MQLPNLKLEQASHEAVESLVQRRVAFSADAVTDHLMRFIAANDQVRPTSQVTNVC